MPAAAAVAAAVVPPLAVTPAPPVKAPPVAATLRVAVAREKGVRYQLDKKLSKLDENMPYHHYRYPCASVQECRLWLIALQTTTHALWQGLLESTCVKPPEVYQTHLHVKKVNRKGVPQTRTIVVTDKRLYNIEREGQVLREPKWSCAVEALSGIEVQELDDKKLPSEKWSVTLRMKPSSSCGAARPTAPPSTLAASAATRGRWSRPRQTTRRRRSTLRSRPGRSSRRSSPRSSSCAHEAAAGHPPAQPDGDHRRPARAELCVHGCSVVVVSVFS